MIIKSEKIFQTATVPYIYAGGQGWDRHLAYVALTRHRRHVELHADSDTFRTPSELLTVFKRKAFNEAALDWPMAFSRRRGFDSESLLHRLFATIKSLPKSFSDFQRSSSRQRDRFQ